MNTSQDAISKIRFSMDDLIDNKRAAGRPQDLLDVTLLERVRSRG
ncbi:MAG TPA: hypothetical protein VF765_18195 [Polyangiaceae bacterium]